MPVVATYNADNFRMLLETTGRSFYLRFQSETSLLSRAYDYIDSLGTSVEEWEDYPFQIMTRRIRMVRRLPRPGLLNYAIAQSSVSEQSNNLIWNSAQSSLFGANSIFLTGDNCGFFIHEITRHNMRISHINLNSIAVSNLEAGQARLNPRCLVANYTRVWSMEIFLREVLHHRAALSLRFMSTCSIVVAVGTGFTMAVGFGPAAGIFGMGSSLSSSTAATTLGISTHGARILNAFASAIASGFTTFLRENFREMERIVRGTSSTNIEQLRRQIDAPGITPERRRQLEGQRTRLLRINMQARATQFWQNNEEGFQRVVSRSIISGAFSYFTSFIPSPRIGSTSDLTIRNISIAVVNRFGNNVTGMIQSIFTHIAEGNTIDSINWRDICQSLTRDMTMRGFG